MIGYNRATQHAADILHRAKAAEGMPASVYNPMAYGMAELLADLYNVDRAEAAEKLADQCELLGFPSPVDLTGDRSEPPKATAKKRTKRI